MSATMCRRGGDAAGVCLLRVQDLARASAVLVARFSTTPSPTVRAFRWHHLAAMTSMSLRLAASTSRMARLAPTRVARLRLRHIHQRKELPYPIEEGLGTFLPPHALKMVAQDYQHGLLERLNNEVRGEYPPRRLCGARVLTSHAGTRLENKSVVQTIINAARDPNMVLEFNYACEALNNSFFLENLVRASVCPARLASS